VRKATDNEDRLERWDYRLYTTKDDGKKIAALQDHRLNTLTPQPVSKLKGTVDVKSRGLSGSSYLVHLISHGRGSSWCRDVNWIALPENDTFRMIHGPSFMKFLRTTGYDVKNPHDTTAEVISLTDRKIRYATEYRDVSLRDGVFHLDQRNNSISTFVNSIALKSISFLL